jgi:glycosyltransferase involved in cell wall biosynthesis
MVSNIGFPATRVLRGFVDWRTAATWQPFSKLIIKNDGLPWVISQIGVELTRMCRHLGVDTVDQRYASVSSNQSIFFVSKYFLEKWKKYRHRIAFPYYHGDPRKDAKFTPLIAAIRKNHQQISRIQVSHREMEQLILDTGISEEKVFLIPISLELSYFDMVTTSSREQERERLGIPNSAVVVGSFQKDGVGMKDGMEPKYIKGPDVFLKTLKILKLSIPELFVVLTGPSRGYIKAELDTLRIPYRHYLVERYQDISNYYHTLDAYVISSREEGGPRAVLESLACGIPLVTTKVGQALDLVSHGVNGWLADVEDAEGLAYWTQFALENKSSNGTILCNGRATAEQNCYQAQIPLWRGFMEGFVET